MSIIGNFGTFEAPEKVNPYIATLEAFAEASKENPEASWTVTVDAAKETAERVLIAQAAHKVDKTARLRTRNDSNRTQVGTREKSGTPVYSGTVDLTFTLSEKHKPRRGKDAETVTEPAKPAAKAGNK